MSGDVVPEINGNPWQTYRVGENEGLSAEQQHGVGVELDTHFRRHVRRIPAKRSDNLLRRLRA